MRRILEKGKLRVRRGKMGSVTKVLLPLKEVNNVRNLLEAFTTNTSTISILEPCTSSMSDTTGCLKLTTWVIFTLEISKVCSNILFFLSFILLFFSLFYFSKKVIVSHLRTFQSHQGRPWNKIKCSPSFFLVISSRF